MSTHSRALYYSPRSRPQANAAPRAALPLSEAIEGFILACKARKLSPHTLADYGRTLRRFLAHVGDMAIGDITTVQISAFLAAQPYSEKTVKNYHIGLAALWTWCIREGHTTRHIVRVVEKPRPQKVVIEPLTQVEVKRILDAAQAGRLAARNRSIVLLLLDTGLRASELINITLADVDFSRRLVKVLGKGNKERMLPFSRRTGQAIFDYMYPLDNLDRLYPLNRDSLAHLTARLGQAAGIRGSVHPHRFRHTFAVTYLRNGGDPYTLQEILGHSTFEMVRHYLALAQIDLEAAHTRASPVENWQL